MRDRTVCPICGYDVCDCAPEVSKDNDPLPTEEEEEVSVEFENRACARCDGTGVEPDVDCSSPILPEDLAAQIHELLRPGDFPGDFGPRDMRVARFILSHLKPGGWKRE